MPPILEMLLPDPSKCLDIAVNSLPEEADNDVCLLHQLQEQLTGLQNRIS